jgi:uncharacterized protein (DUF697 family)/uncharacterized tellurite resistance protein B-like protein
MTPSPPTPPTDAELNGLLTIATLAALADGTRDERERAQLREVAARLGGGRVDLAVFDRPDAVDRPSLAAAVRPLSALDTRRYAYELAVAVVDADGVHNAAEGAFLRELASALGLPAEAAAKVVADADAIATAAVAATGTAAPASGHVMPDAADLDRRIVGASITNAALELLPETLASMAILPLQVRLVYRIGQAYGYELDQGHIKEFIATLGVGLAGQYLEQFGRKLLGGLLGSVLGGIGRAAGHQAASSGLSFATTWALGQLAKQYYGGGRTLDAAKLKDAFAPLLDQGQQLVQRYGGEIAERARTIDVRNLPALIRQL